MKLFSIEDIIELLRQFNEKQADELEGQHLDFKELSVKAMAGTQNGTKFNKMNCVIFRV